MSKLRLSDWQHEIRKRLYSVNIVSTALDRMCITAAEPTFLRGTGAKL